MIWNIFKQKNDDTAEESENQLFEKIEQAIKKSKAEKQAILKSIKEIDGWARDAIIDVYADFFPNSKLSYYRDRYKTDILEKYFEVKSKYDQQADKILVAQCEKIVSGYLSQIELLKTKIQFYEKLEKQYNDTLQKYEAVKQRTRQMEKLGKHTDRLNELNQNSEHLASAYTSNYELEEVQKEVALQTEIINQMELLNNQYATEDNRNFTNSTAYKSEIDKLIGNL